MLLSFAALIGGCNEKDTVANGTAAVKIAGKTYFLEIAADNDKRMLGLGGRTQIAPDGGMIFVFPASQVAVQSFVMRDCPIDIDIIYTDGVGRVLAAHEMRKEPPRDESKGEGKSGDMANANYDARLPRYSSRYPATFAIELKSGSIKDLGVKEGDLFSFDYAALKKLAQ
jgi:uncharacterized membrane protein (UPF0127 family)